MRDGDTKRALKASAMSGPKHAGRTNLLKHYDGIRITQREAILAKCYDCNGMGEQNTCDLDECPLHPYSAYGKKHARMASAGVSEESEV